MWQPAPAPQAGHTLTPALAPAVGSPLAAKCWLGTRLATRCGNLHPHPHRPHPHARARPAGPLPHLPLSVGWGRDLPQDVASRRWWGDLPGRPTRHANTPGTPTPLATNAPGCQHPWLPTRPGANVPGCQAAGCRVPGAGKARLAGVGVITAETTEARSPEGCGPLKRAVRGSSGRSSRGSTRRPNRRSQ